MLKSNRPCGLYAVFLAAFLILGGCAPPAAKSDLRPAVRTHTVSAAEDKASFTFAGQVRGRYERSLSFQFAGKIARRLVEEGSRVNKGDELMRLDAKDALQLVNEAAAQLEAAKSSLSLDKLNHGRARTLQAAGAFSAAQGDEARARYEVSLAAYHQAQAQYAKSANALEYTVLTADNAGVVASVGGEAGQVVAAGQPVVLLVSDLEVEIYVPENQSVSLGQSARLSFWALPGAVFSGKIREVSPAADQATRTYRVRLSVDEPPAALRFGMTASVAVDGRGRTGIFIPLSCLYQTASRPAVWVVEDGKVSLKEVSVGRLRADEAEITAGLSGGELVVSAGAHKLRAGQQIRLYQTP